MSAVDKASNIIKPIIHGLESLSAVADLGIRLWVAWVFWKSGQTKIANWDSTLFLFEDYYSVPVLSPEAAAYLGTAVELSMPVLLAVGLAARFGAVVLLLFNIVAVLSLPELRAVDVQNHTLWGLMLLVTLFHGPGKWSIDHLVRQRFWG
ncbi:MAG: DoxX family protein [Gammaproteobacteria bacterium]|nr:DoxX family protein [Gammaproteobacteria bacterium]